jgi:hypothetical protein
MTDIQLATALEGLIALAILSLLVFNLYPASRLDAFRQKMFAQRDQLWDYAAAGKISFEDPAYLLLRKLMNGFIRYGHQLSFFRVVMTTIHWHAFGQAPERTWHAKWNKALSQVEDPEVRQHLEAARQGALTAMAKHLTTGSPILLTMLVGVAIGTAAAYGITSLRQLLKNAGFKSLDFIFDTAMIEENAARYRSSHTGSFLRA